MRYSLNYITAVVALSGLVAVLHSAPASAVAFEENEDAGEALGSAQIIPSGPMMLETISGTLSGFDDPADLFQIFLAGGQTFSATTVDSADFDTRLFLFGEQGFGIYFNEDASSETLQSALPASNAFTPTNSGIYYLGIASFDYSPVNAEGNRIFPSFSDFPIDTPLETIFTSVSGPTGPGDDAPLSGFDGAILSSGGSYTIALTGVQAGEAAESVPEPASTLALLALGAAGAALHLKKRQEQADLS
ncbi:PEP-CTERM sorting domain-containing protein [Pseudanabaena sp. FACHB-2040]|uniref:PEP-CTERM sorting domain-containing protein n=1 Tax=Pseudanabaena sp. FACHB-2040 TaxID=2692859 RepID=UPI0019C87D2B|nr:PEP-CTERM sorting domain-containing protein [Pseudanabaena sp. FACHB-2040]MBD2258266.1 PEP-CTERM sorting domain-containing protein [Pseudanabaena sp. FACHB-2040]